MPFPKDRLVATEYQPFDAGQPPVHFGERTGIQSVITSPWVLRWASIPATYATYREIRKLGTIAMARELKVAPVLASEWTIDADDDAPQEWQTLIQKTFFPLRDEFMSAALYYGDVDFGYTCFEKIIEPKDGYLKIVRFKPLLHDITEICIGHQGGFIGVRQLGKDLGLANSVHVGFRVEGSYLYGIPLLENCRQAYNMWIECNEGARRYDRKIAGAHIVVEYPLGSCKDRNGTVRDNGELARTVLDELQSAGGVAIPRDMAAFMEQLNLESPGWKIWMLDAGSNQQGTFVERLDYLDKQLCRSLHIPERAMMEGAHGTLAEAEAHADVIFTIQDIEHRRVTAELNRQAVDQVLTLNFGKQAVGKVRLKASPIVDEKKEFFKQIYEQLLASPAGQRELQSLDAASLREQLGLPQVQNDPGDVEHPGANLQAFRGLPQPPPGGAGQTFLTKDRDGRPVTVDGQAEQPAAALANAVWGMREAIALSSTALERATGGHGDAETRGRGGAAAPLQLAGSAEKAKRCDYCYRPATHILTHPGYLAKRGPTGGGRTVKITVAACDEHANCANYLDHAQRPDAQIILPASLPEPLELAGTESVQQPPWQEEPQYRQPTNWDPDQDPDDEPDPDYEVGPELTKIVPIGERDALHFRATPTESKASLVQQYGPQADAVRREHALDYPHEFAFGRKKVEPVRNSALRYNVTGQGQAGLIMSHAVHAVRDLLQTRRPMIVSFTAAEPSRQAVYEHLARRAVKQAAGEGGPEYRAFREGDNPHAFHLVHTALAHLPALQRLAPDLEEIGAGEPVGAGMSNRPSALWDGEDWNEEGRGDAATRGRGETETDALPLELAATDPVEQAPWQPHERLPGVMVKDVPLDASGGQGDRMRIASQPLPPVWGQFDSVRRQYKLGAPQTVAFTRRNGPRDVRGTYDIAGQGKAGLVLSHAAHAVRELVAQRPVALIFSAEEKSRNNAYMHMLRRACSAARAAGNTRCSSGPAPIRRPSPMPSCIAPWQSCRSSAAIGSPSTLRAGNP